MELTIDDARKLIPLLEGAINNAIGLMESDTIGPEDWKNLADYKTWAEDFVQKLKTFEAPRVTIN